MSFLKETEGFLSVLSESEIEFCADIYAFAIVARVHHAFPDAKLVCRGTQSVNHQLNSALLIGTATLRSIIHNKHLLSRSKILNKEACSHRIEVGCDLLHFIACVGGVVPFGLMDVPSYDLESVGVCVEQPRLLYLEVEALPIDGHVLPEHVQLKAYPREEHIELQVLLVHADLHNSLRLAHFLGFVVNNHLLHQLPLKRLNTRDGVIEWARVLVLSLEDIETALDLPRTMIGLIVPEVEVEGPIQ